MSTGVSDQRMRGQGSQANGPNKDQLNDHEDFSSWRNQSIQNSYVSPAVAAATTSDHYLSSYYGPTFSYQLDHGTWSSNSAGGDTPFLAGYGAPSQQQQQQQQQHQDSYGIDGMFGPGGFSNFGAQPTAFGGGYGDYSTPWDRKAAHYDDYYHQQQHHHNQHPMYPQAATSRLEESSPSAAAAKQVEQGMQGLALETAKQQQQQESQQPKKLTWASIASQPAKPQLATKKKSMVPPPMVTPRTPSLDIGTWENKNGSNNPQQQQAPSNVVVQPPPVQQPPPQQQQQQQQRPARPTPPPAQPVTPPKTIAAVVAAPAPPAPLPPVQPPVVVAAAAAAVQPNAINNPVLEELQSKHIYNPKEFDLSAKNARFFVIKSYSEDDIHRSIKYEIWCSTEHGNKRLDAAFRERDGKGPVYLYFSVNGSGHFCGMAEMTSAVDMSSTLSVWSQDKWRGQFTVKWIYVKDVPNAALRHIRLENNENKPVTNSRDTQEVPVEKGRQVLKILHSYRHATSIFDDFSHYEKRQAEEDQRKTTVSSPGGGDNYENERNIPPPPPPQQRERDQRESYNNRPEQRRDGGFERDHHRPMDSRDFRGRNDRSGYDNYRDRDTRDSRDGGYQRDRDQHQRGPYRPSSDRETQGYRSNDRGDRGPVSGGGRGRSGDASRPRH